MVDKKRYARIILLLVVLFTATLGQNFLIPGSAQAADQTVYFSETGHSISGKFLDYWQKNGGLQVYGYPITDPAMETDPETGKAFLTQWFERNRFELHPENAGTKYEVLLGLLGKDLQRDALQLDPAFQPAKAKTGAAFFAETGHNLEGAFLDYWLANGGLERFGYPISEAHSEGSYETGVILWTQWFERARFEFDPRNQPPYNVQLGLLGVQIKTHPPIKNSNIITLWQTKSSPGLLYGSRVRGVDGQNNILVINGHADGSIHSAAQPDPDYVVQRFTSDGQLALTFGLDHSITDATVDKAGNSYVVAYVAGPNNHYGYEMKIYDKQGQLLREWAIKDIETVLHTTVDNLGNIYVSGYWTVKKYDQQGNVLATLINYQENHFENLVRSLATDSQNNLWVSVSNDKQPDQTITRIMHFDSQANSLGQWDVNIPDQSQDEYEQIAVDGQDNVFLVNQRGQFIAKFSGEGKFLAKWVGADNLNFTDINNGIKSMALDNQGNILLSLNSQPFILKLDPQGHYLSQLGAPANDQLKCSANLAWLDNNLYVTDNFLGKVIKLDSNGQFQAGLAVPGEQTDGQLKDLVTNGQNLYLWKGNTIYRYNAQGQAQGKLDATLSDYTELIAVDRNEKVFAAVGYEKGGEGLGKRIFDGVRDIAIDQQGTLYAAATLPTGSINYFLGLINTPHIYKFNADQTDFAGQWSKNGTADEEFKSAELTFDAQDNLYVLDSDLGRVQKFDQNGKLLSKWASPDLKNIWDFQIDPSGNLYGVKDCGVVKIKLG